MRALLDALADYLETELTLYAPVKVGNLDSRTDAISLFQAPSPSGPRFYDRKRVKIVLVQLFAKSENQQQVIDAMELMTDSLELGNGAITVPKYDFIKSEIYTEPNRVEETSTNQHVYSALIQCELERRD